MDIRILVVEDEYDGQQVVSKMLKYMGMAADVYDRAEDALDALSNNTYNAAILDLALPGMDGINMLQEIRAESAFDNMPCIIMTAYHNSSVKQQALEAGCDAYFPKPLDDTTFMREIERLLG